jgi:hypothetical protein
VNLHVPAIAEAFALDDILRKAREAREGVAGQYASPVADHVAVVIVLGGFYKVDVKCFSHVAA